MPWYALFTRPRHEILAVSNLGWLGLDAYCPVYIAELRHARRVVDTPRPFFSRYIFLRVQPDHPEWATAMSRERREVLGISTIVYAGGSPLTIPDAVIDEIKSREVDGVMPGDQGAGVRVEVYQRGEKVKITGGPFAGFFALIANVDNAQRVSVWLDLFGRKSSARVPVAEIEKVDFTRSATAF